MKLSREAIDKIFKECYELLEPEWREEFAKFLFSHFYFLICVIGDENKEIDISAINAFRTSFRKNMESEGLWYIQYFFQIAPRFMK